MILAARKNCSVLPAAAICAQLAGLLLFCVSGCRNVPEYTPPLLPVFMREDSASGTEGATRSADSSQPRSEVKTAGFRPRAGTPAAESASPDDQAPRPVLSAPLEVGQDEKLPPPRSLDGGLTLNEIIESCLQADPRIKAAWEDIQQAKADYVTSWIIPNPYFYTDSQLNPLTRPFTVTNQGGPPQMDWYFNWPIDWYLSGERAAAMAAAKLGVEVSTADFANMIRQRVAAAIAAHFDVLEARALRDLARQDLENLRQLEAITRKKFEGKAAAKIDVDRVRLAVLESQKELRRRQTLFVTAVANLRSLMGLQDSDPGFTVAGDMIIVSAARPLDEPEAWNMAQETRPDIIALRKKLDKAAADIKVQIAKGYPPVTPWFGFTRQFQRKAIGFPDANSWLVALSMNIPVFDRNQGNILKAKSQRAEDYYNLQAGLVSLRAEVAQAVQEFFSAHQNVTMDDPRQLEAARAVRDTITEAYKVGGRTLLEVLDAQRAYRDTYRLFIMSQSAYWHALHRINAAIGKQVLR
jgi:cobalt-zinc-cadmium efflux system outer membrane protein